MPKKVCFISNYAYRLFNAKSRITYGGIETIFYLIASDLLKDKRFEPVFLLEDDVNRESKTEVIGGITLYKTSRFGHTERYHDLQVEKYNRWFRSLAEKFERMWQWPHLDFFRLWDKLKAINADVYIFAMPGYESGLITLITKIIGKNSIFIAVNDEVLTNKSLFRIVKFANAVMCYSPRHQQILRQKHRLKAVYLPPWFPPPKTVLPFRQRKYLLWVGRIETRKHPEILLALAKKLPSVKLVMIAAPSPSEPVLYQKIILKAAGAPNVVLKQNVDFAKLGNYYRKALAFIDTSGYKNLNMTQVQAAWYKTPGLSYWFDPNDSYAKFKWGLAADGKMKKMIRNINAVRLNKRAWEELSAGAIKFARTVYSRERNLAAFKDLLLKLTK